MTAESTTLFEGSLRTEAAKVLQFYQHRFVRAYATVVALTNAHPEQVNHEIRNAMAHLARAQTIDSPDLIREETVRSRTLVESATRDCLKLAIAKLKWDISNAIRSISRVRGGFDADLLQDYNAVEAELLRVLEMEDKPGTDANHSVKVIDLYENVLSCLLKIRGIIQKRHNVPTAGSPRKLSMSLLWRRLFWSPLKALLLIALVVLGVLVGLFFLDRDWIPAQVNSFYDWMGTMVEDGEGAGSGEASGTSTPAPGAEGAETAPSDASGGDASGAARTIEPAPEPQPVPAPQ